MHESLFLIYVCTYTYACMQYQVSKTIFVLILVVKGDKQFPCCSYFSFLLYQLSTTLVISIYVTVGEIIVLMNLSSYLHEFLFRRLKLTNFKLMESIIQNVAAISAVILRTSVYSIGERLLLFREEHGGHIEHLQ